MSIIKAYALPHPPLAVAKVGRGDEKRIPKTLAALDNAAREIAALAPDTIIFITPHSTAYSDYFHISPGHSAKGDFARFGAHDVTFQVKYDRDFVTEISRLAEGSGLRAGSIGELDALLDHGVTVPMWFINQHYSGYQAVRISQSGMDSTEHYRLGQLIAQAAENMGRRTLLIASGDLSHKLAGSKDFAPEGEIFDKAVVDALSTADFLSLLQIPVELRERAGECGYNSYVILAGCFDRLNVEATLLSYECPFGVGYAAASFTPIEINENNSILESYIEALLFEARKRQKSEDAYCALARLSLETMVTGGENISLPDNLPVELLQNRAGVFVSLHKNGHLRGCVGTLAPTTDNVALEIIQNAVSAGMSDNRFEPVDVSELPLFTYKVDVLSAPEAISGEEELDVKRYGVIVSSGNKRGLLLPDLDGIDSPKQQIAIARRKAGILENEPVRLERFEVIRHQ